MLAKFQSAAKSKISISRDNSPAKNLNMTDDNTNLKMEQNKMVEAQKVDMQSTYNSLALR